MRSVNIKKILVLGNNPRSTAIFDFLTNRHLEVSRACEQTDEENRLTQSSLTDFDLTTFDLAILAGWSTKIEARYLQLPKFGFVTCHAGKLPEYRGSSPLNWAIINNEKTFGLSVIKTDTNFDTGPIYASREFDLKEDYKIKDLHRITNEQFPLMILETLFKIETLIEPTCQTTARVMYYPRRDKNDSRIDFQKMDCLDVMSLFRAVDELYPQPFFFAGGAEVSIQAVLQIDKSFSGTPGKIYRLKNNTALIACQLGAVWIEVAAPHRLKKYENIV